MAIFDRKLNEGFNRRLGFQSRLLNTKEVQEGLIHVVSDMESQWPVPFVYSEEIEFIDGTSITRDLYESSNWNPEDRPRYLRVRNINLRLTEQEALTGLYRMRLVGGLVGSAAEVLLWELYIPITANANETYNYSLDLLLPIKNLYDLDNGTAASPFYINGTRQLYVSMRRLSGLTEFTMQTVINCEFVF